MTPVAGALRDEHDALVMDVKVVPRSSRERIGPVVGDRVKVQLTAPPVDGAANQALRALLASALGVGRARVTIVRGETSQKKTVRIEGATRQAMQALLDGAAGEGSAA